MVAAVLVVLVALDTFWTGVQLMRTKQLISDLHKETELVRELANVSQEHDFALQVLSGKDSKHE